MNNNLEKTFASLEQSVEKALRENPSAEYAVAVATAKGNAYCAPIFSTDDHTDALRFAQSLADLDDTEILSVLCKWQGGSLTVTALALTRKLIEINPKNAQALILLQGSDGRNARTLESILPPQ